MYLSAPSILQNFRKILRVDPELMTMCHFQVQNGLFVRNKIFLIQIIIITFIYLKKFSQRIQSYEKASF